MHVLQPKQTKLKPEEVEKLLTELNISLMQLPKIKITDVTLLPDCQVADIIKVERVSLDGKKSIYHRVVSV
jgi:DNA-directed RNA polymerase subunit H (RpoH/RPB5)